MNPDISRSISELENKLLLHATLGDLKAILQSALREDTLEDNIPHRPSGRKIFGIKGIADELGISISTAKRHLSSGKLDGAITKVGKLIVADVDALWAIFQCNKKLKYGR